MLMLMAEFREQICQIADTVAKCCGLPIGTKFVDMFLKDSKQIECNVRWSVTGTPS